MLSSALFGRSRTSGLSTDDKTKLEEMTNLVDQATSDILNSVDWSANMQLVDQINCTSNPLMLREVVRHLRKRLQMKSSRVVMNSLTLAETLVMNCHTRFHHEVATDKFMEAVARVARTNCLAPHYDRSASEVAGKALELVQSWGEAFRAKHAALPLFLDTYVSLKLEGLPFGDLDAEAPKPPVFTPRPSASASPERPSAEQSTGSAGGPREAASSGSTPRPESLLEEAKRAAAELRAEADALEGSSSGRRGAQKGESLGQGLDGVDAKLGPLADRCRNLQTQLSLLVQRGMSEAHLEPMLATNDELLAALNKLESVRLVGTSSTGGGGSGSSSRSSSRNRNSSSGGGGGGGGGGGTSSGVDLMGASSPERLAEIPKLKPPRSDTPPRPRRPASGAAAAAEDLPQANAPPPSEPSPFLGLVMDPTPPPSALGTWPPQGSANSSLAIGAQGSGGACGGTSRISASGYEEMGPSGSAPAPATVPAASGNPFDGLVTEQSQGPQPTRRDPFAGLVADLK